MILKNNYINNIVLLVFIQKIFVKKQIVSVRNIYKIRNNVVFLILKVFVHFLNVVKIIIYGKILKVILGIFKNINCSHALNRIHKSFRKE